MPTRKAPANQDILTSIARTVGTTAGLIVSAANRLTASKPTDTRKKTKRRMSKKQPKAAIKPKIKIAKKARRNTVKKRK